MGERTLLFGRSIGGAVAIQLMDDLLQGVRGGSDFSALLPVPAGLVLENTFTSLREMAVEIFPMLSPLSFLLRAPLLRDPWDSSKSVQRITSLTDHWCCCLLSGMQDQIVPPEMMTKLHTLLKVRRPKVLKFFRFANGGHNDTPSRGGNEYWKSFLKFLEEVLTTEEDRLAGASAAASQDQATDADPLKSKDN